MIYLLAALVAPVAGAALYRVLHSHPRAVHVVDGFVYVAVPVLVALQVLPSAWSDRDPMILLAVAGGLAVPQAMERLSRALHRHTDSMALVVGLSGLALHALLEGAALVPGEGSGGMAFGLAVVLHRLPVGLVVWWLVRPRYGVARAVMGVGSVVLATLVGYVLGYEVLGDMHGPGAHVYQAFVSGSLVHVVFHQGRHDHSHR